jgi:hypothetical protein
MKTRMWMALLVGLGLSGVAGLVAADEKLDEALMHTREAISEGQAGRSERVAEHAQEALEAARTARADPHLTEATTHLEEAIAAAQAGDASSATMHAKAAQRHLEQSG